MFRIGTGYDVHALLEDRSITGGGVTINHSKGLLGHSDVDVLAHAISDAFLGALPWGVLGTYFQIRIPNIRMPIALYC